MDSSGRIFRLLHMIMYIVVSLMLFGMFIFNAALFKLMPEHSLFFLIGAIGSAIALSYRVYCFDREHIPYLIDMENDKSNKKSP
jgi:hypothetical protein